MCASTQQTEFSDAPISKGTQGLERSLPEVHLVEKLLSSNKCVKVRPKWNEQPPPKDRPCQGSHSRRRRDETLDKVSVA